MDAAQTNNKKFALFLALALLLTVSTHGSAQTLTAATQTVNLGSTSCNDFQNVLLTSSTSANISFTAAVQYYGSTPTVGDANGAWVYTTILGTGTTSSGTTITGNTGTTGVNLTIGANRFPLTSDTAQVIVTPTSGPGAGTQIAIAVNYQTNTSCGGNTGSASNGQITVTPGNISLAAAAGATNQQTLVIQNLTGNTITFTVGTLPNTATWLQYQYNSLSISSNGQTPVTVIGNAASLASASQPYTGTVVITPSIGTAVDIPVSFQVGTGSTTGTGSSGTLTVNGTASNAANETFNYTSGSPLPSALPVAIQDTAAGANQFSYTVTTTGGNWLLANNSTGGSASGLLAPGDGAQVSLSLSNAATSLAAGNYQGTVTLTSSSGSTATITVFLYVTGSTAPGITVSPSTIVTFPGVPLSSTSVQQQTVTLSAASGYSLGLASLGSNTNSAFSITSPVFSGSTETFTVSANATGLTAGVYSAIITVSSSGTTAGTTTILVSLPVGQAGNTGGTGTGTGTVTSAVAPTSLVFQEQAGSTYWNNQQAAQAVTITGQQGTSWSATIVYGSSAGGWLTFDSPALGTGTFGSGPATLMVDLFNQATNLSPATYTATVNVTTPSGTTSVTVTLLVAPANTAVLFGKPSSATFASNSGSVPNSQTATIVGTDNPNSTNTPPISAGTPTATWLTATTSGNTLTINVNPNGQQTGVYSATIPVSATAYQNAINYPVVLVVNGGLTSTTGVLNLSNTSLSFTNVTGSASSTLNVTASSSTSFTATTSEQSCTAGSTWLSISPGGSLTAGSSNTAIVVTVNSSGIANGATCNGTVLLATTSGTQSVSVAMTVGAAGGSGNITLTPNTPLSFQYIQGQTTPANQTVAIANANSGTSGINFTVTSAVAGGVSNWLTTSASSGQTPYTLSIGVNTSSLQASSTPYTGTVTITPNGGTAQVVNVSLTVTSIPTVTATPTSISLSYQVGGNSPTSTIQVSAGGAAANFTATATSSGGWLQVSPTSGTTPNTGTANLTVSLVQSVLSTLNPNPTGSPYTGSITIAGSSPATGTTIVNVTLNITAPLPAITGITNAASGAVGAVSPGEIISIYANASNPIGPPSSFGLTLVNGSVATTLGGVQVIFLPTNTPAALTFVSAGQINAVVPYEIAPIASSLSVEIRYLGQTSNAFPITQATTAPGIFTANSSGSGQAAVVQYTPQGVYAGVNSASNPATKGWYLVLYMTGEGVVNPGAKDGAVTQVSATPPTTPQPYFVPSVLIGNQPASVAYYGEAAGLVSGVLQVNVIVPQTAPTGPASVSVSLGAAATQGAVTVYLN